MLNQISLPVDLTIYDIKIDTGLIGLLLFFLVFLIVFYTSLYNKYDPFSIFDHVFKTFLIVFIISRALAVVNNLDYYLSDLSLILNFSDMMFFYPGILFGVIISSMFFSNKIATKLGYMTLLDLSLKAYVISSVFLILGFSLSGRIIGVTYEGPIALAYDDGINRFPYGFIEVIYNLISILILFLLSRSKTKHGIPTAVYIMIFAGVEFILRFFSMQFIPTILGVIDLYQFIYLVMIVFAIMIFLRINQVQTVPNPDLSERTRIDIDEFRKDKASAKEIFSLSYTSMDNRKDENLPVHEKLNNWYKGVKRKTQAGKGR